AARVQTATLAERDQLLDDPPQVLRLRQGRGDLLVLQERMGHVVEHGLAVRAGAAELTAGIAMAHGRSLPPLGLSRVPRGAWRAPRCSPAANSGSPSPDGAPFAPALP